MSRKKNRLRLSFCMAVPVFFCCIMPIVSRLCSVERSAQWKPGYEKVNLTPMLDQRTNQQSETGGEQMSEEDYILLYAQTGLAKPAIDYLFAHSRQWELLLLQERFFAPVEILCSPNTILTREERIVDAQNGSQIAEQMPFQEGEGTLLVGAPAAAQAEVIPYIEAGDILITFNCHALGWRNGHAALVVDAQERLVLEASQLGSLSRVISMDHWETYPSFVLLRLKDTSVEQRAAVAAYALEYLEGVPYRLEAGIKERAAVLLPGIRKQREISAIGKPSYLPSGTHCAHLVWFACTASGYDLDSDGGLIVTPRDIFESPLLEVVQIYGMEKFRQISREESR